MSSDPSSTEAPTQHQHTVLVYSDDRTVRDAVRHALGGWVGEERFGVRTFDVATARAVNNAMDNGGVDVVVLDGEATPAGGMGICRQLKDEIAHCPPVLVLVGRRDDAWLATWSRADAVQAHPIDPVRLPEAVAGLIRAGQGDDSRGEGSRAGDEEVAGRHTAGARSAEHQEA